MLGYVFGNIYYFSRGYVGWANVRKTKNRVYQQKTGGREVKRYVTLVERLIADSEAFRQVNLEMSVLRSRMSADQNHVPILGQDREPPLNRVSRSSAFSPRNKT